MTARDSSEAGQSGLTDTRTHLFLLLLITVYAVIARFYGLDRLGLWSDELWVVIESRRESLWDMLQYVYDHDNHPPGHYLLMRYTQALFGYSDFAIRLPSAVAGVLLVLFTFIAGRKHLSVEAALIAAALVASSYQSIYYSQEARANILLALFALTAFHYFRALVLEGDRDRKNYLLLWVSAILLVYLHYAGLVFVLCLVLVYAVLFFLRLTRQTLLNNLKEAAYLFGPVLIVYLPWFPGVYHDLFFSPPEGWQKAPDWHSLDATHWFLYGPDALRQNVYRFVFALSFLLPLLLLIRTDRLPKASIQFCALAFILSVLPVLAFFIKSNISQSAYNHRHFLFAIPLMALVAGYGLSLPLKFISPAYRSMALVVVVAAIFYYCTSANQEKALYTAQHYKEKYREAVELLSRDSAFLSDTENIIVANNRFFNHYLETRLSGTKADYLVRNENQIRKLHKTLSSGDSEFLYFLERFPSPRRDKLLIDILSQHYSTVCRQRFMRVQVVKFQLTVPGRQVDWQQVSACDVAD